MSKLFQEKHTLWLNVLYSSFAINDEKIKSDLYDFAMIEFRHLKWLGKSLVEQGIAFNYDRDMQLDKSLHTHQILENLLLKIQNIHAQYDEGVLAQRMRTDELYLIEYIKVILKDMNTDKAITAYNLKREYGALKKEQLDAFILFLFEESYKEYELIMVYLWMQFYTKDLLQFDIYQDLIDESQFHLKSFSNMMSKLGILTLPRELHELTYKVKDVKKFIIAGIAEEEAAKEMCKALSRDINDEELSKFFDFINYQESYHIALMKKLL